MVCVEMDVCELKRLLAAAGFPRFTKTQNTIKAFQKSKRLSADGIAGPLTIAALGGRGTHNEEATDEHVQKLYSKVKAIRSGASLREELGSTARYAEIVAANRLKTATLHAGMVLQLPTDGGSREE